MCYRKYNDGFYVKSNKKINNIFEIAKYIGRYLARSAIAEYRITDITNSSATFWYQKPDSPRKNISNSSYVSIHWKIISTYST